MSYKNMVRLLLPGLAGGLIVLVLVGVVGGALHNPRPKDLPIAVVAPPAMSQKLQKIADAKVPGAVRVIAYADVKQANQDLRDAKVYGVISASQKVNITVSSATDEASKQIATAIGNGAAMAMQKETVVTDVAPRASGPGRTIVLLFLLLATTIGAFVSQLLTQRDKQKGYMAWIGTSVLYAAIIGLSGAGIATMLGEFNGAFWNIVTILAIYSFAICAFVGGLQHLLGKAGTAVAAFIFIPLGIATSGVMVNQYFLPPLYAAIAPFMPSLATVEAIRQAAYLDNAALNGAYVVLGVWALIGVILRRVDIFTKKEN